MNKELNIAEILKDKPQGTKLYTPISGDVWLVKDKKDKSTCNYPIVVSRSEDDGIQALNTFAFTAQGQYMNTGECLLFPSKDMRDWEKFTWKRGDVLKCIDTLCVFDGWTSDDYTQFQGKYSILFENASPECFFKNKIYDTNCFHKVDMKARNSLIANLEKEYKGKFNPKTLEIENLHKKYDFKPFDKVLVRDNIKHMWEVAIFAFYDDSADRTYKALNITNGGSYYYRYCIPYEGNEDLVNTSII